MIYQVPKEIKILSVGNSFSVDTMEHVAGIALSLGVERIKLGNLYVGGCSINMHYAHAMADAPVYKYYVNEGAGWSSTPETKISDAVRSERWDIISALCAFSLSDLPSFMIPTTAQPVRV